MYRLVTATAAVALLSSAAFAADIPVYEPPMDVPAAVAAYDWTGFYVGAFGGYAWGESDVDFDIGTSFDGDPEGWFAGGTLGFNWQMNMFVLGLEGDIAWADIEDDSTPCPNPAFACTTEVDWLGSARLRAGLAFDRFLVYATGGAGFGDVEYDAILLATGASFGGGDDDVQFGWTAGGGIEIGVWQNWSVKGEYLYYDLGDQDVTAASFGSDGDADINLHTAKFGINYRF